MGRGVRRFTELRAWQACNAYKLAVYRVCADGPLAQDWTRRRQLEESVAGPPGHLAEGFGRFNPADFARFAVIARSSLMESQNHLRDAVDRHYVTEANRQELDLLAESALREVTGLMEYLHSADALRNARRARERRVATRSERRTQNREPEPEPEPEHEPRSENREE
jgi:four helix bundle protein